MADNSCPRGDGFATTSYPAPRRPILPTAGFELVRLPEGYGEVRIYYIDLKSERLCFVNAQGRVGQVDYWGNFAKIRPEAGCPPIG